MSQLAATVSACSMPRALIQLGLPGRTDLDLAMTPEIAALLTSADTVVAIGVSGGKDSCAAAFATVEYLRRIGFAGTIVLVHSDLGRVEWRESLPVCERLAARLGVELIVVRRAAGDMMDRWLTRWRNNMRRYANLLCVRTILPWSTPSMRFCTSELKTKVIAAELTRRFAGRTIVSVSGIRREESANREKAEVAKRSKELSRKARRTTGYDWNAIVEWSERDVRALCAARGFELHIGYTRYGMTRISCAFCIMGNANDLAASARCEENQAIYREMVDLEIASAFAFQGAKWLGDVAPHLLSDAQLAGLARAKQLAAGRKVIEARIPKHLLYIKGWPKVMPTAEEAELLCVVRREVAALYGQDVKYTEPTALLARYAELMAIKAAKDAAKARTAKSRKARTPKAATAALEAA